MAEPIHLDGTTLEGGGQLLRLSLSLSSLTGTAINVTDIRGKRGSKPGQDSGIKPAHLAGGLWLAGATSALTDGLSLRSQNLVFRPNKFTSSSGDAESIWQHVYKPDHYSQGKVSIAIQTPGSVFLILQSILPFLLFAGCDPGQDPSKPINVVIEGGTNVWHSLSYEYADQVLFPMLREKVGFGPISMKLHRRGWSVGRSSIGKVEIDITPLALGQTLPAFEYIERGDITAFKISVLGQDPKIRTEICKMATDKLSRWYPDADIEVAVDESTDHPSRLYLLVVAESANGYRLGRDWLFDQKINKDKPIKTVEKLVTKVLQDLRREIAHGGCVDEWLQDQLVVFQALAEGKCAIDGPNPSLHTQTARWVAEEILGIKFNAGGHCKGIGLRAVARKMPDSNDIAQEFAQKLNIKG